MSDPFDPFETADNDITETKQEAPAVQTPPESNEISVTLKGGTGFDAPWVVLRASSVSEALDALGDADLPTLLDKAAKAGAYFASKGASKPAPQASQGGGQAPAHQQAPGGEERFCSHGKMVFKSGVSQKTGKPYSMFACTERDRNAQCKAQFLN